MDLGKDVTRIDGRKKWTRHVYLSIWGAKMAKIAPFRHFGRLDGRKNGRDQDFRDFQKYLRGKYFWKITVPVRNFSNGYSSLYPLIYIYIYISIKILLFCLERKRERERENRGVGHHEPEPDAEHVDASEIEFDLTSTRFDQYGNMKILIELVKIKIAGTVPAIFSEISENIFFENIL